MGAAAPAGMTPPRLAIVDGGGANIASLRFALARLGVDGQLTSDPDVIRAATHVILPGVGAARDAMRRLEQHGLVAVLRGLTQPLLGICLGMQLLAESSEEEDTACLGLLRGVARRLPGGPDRPVPHMGWNRVFRTRTTTLFDGIPDGAQFYFVHSYALPVAAYTVGRTEYGETFSAVIEQGNVCATQFHPERSSAHGARLLQNFLRR
jgi:glutamine amidotransferase